MRGRKAKLLRRAAEALTVGAPPVEHMEAGRRVERRLRPTDKKPVTLWASRCELSARCTRSVYQRLKKAMPKGRALTPANLAEARDAVR